MTTLSKDDLLADPFLYFKQWLNEAKKKGEIEPAAMTLATVNKQYEVAARMVLLKSFDHKGFVFYTNYTSVKAQHLKEIPKAALVSWWPLCQRQVRITGVVSLLDEKLSDEYFNQRPRDSRIAAIISAQSKVIPDRAFLLEKYHHKLKELEEHPIPRPHYWGGYILKPQVIEFWQERPHRLHDRFQYTKKDAGWEIERLSP